MTEVEEPQFTTLAERIAALNKQKNFSSGPTSQPPLRSPSTASAASGAVRRPPPPPPVPKTPAAAHNGSAASISTVHSLSHGANGSALAPRQAPLPVRGPPPKLPPRQPSGQQLQLTSTAIDRRPSSDSVRSHVSTATTLSRMSSATSQTSASLASDGTSLRKLPPAFGTTKLPPLPPSRREREAKEREEAERAAEREYAEAEAAEREADAVESRPALPSRPGSFARGSPSDQQSASAPRLPPRPRTAAAADSHRSYNSTDGANDYNDDDAPAPALPSRRSSVRSSLDMGFNSLKSLSRRSGPQPVAQWRRDGIAEDDEDDDRPPPLPMASRPSRAQINAVVRGTGGAAEVRPALPTRPNQRAARGGGGAPGFCPKKSEDEECLKCRDFSEPDEIASRFPVANLPRDGTVVYLAHNLCDAFPSETDKARAIFTWCHHNIAYDVDGFFNNRVPRNQTLEERIFSGKAVCEGYARVYEALALAAGLECVVISGHGKGFGFNPVLPGQRIPPPNPTGHAWNAVRIDGGEWKLLDACWGAGSICDKRKDQYQKRFSPEMFTMDNETFGERHYPEDPRYFFRADGRTPSWAEYVVEKQSSPPIIIYSNAPEQHIESSTVEPHGQEICVSRGDPNELIAFRFGRPCHHWTMEKQGHNLRPYPMMLQVASADGDRKGDMIDVEYDHPLWFWADVPRRKLGRPGDMLFCYAMTTLDGRDLRGGTMADVRRRLGRCSMAFQAVCSWKIV